MSIDRKQKTLYDVPWDDGSGETFRPSKQQARRGLKFLKLWDVPVGWITYAYAHNPKYLKDSDVTDRDWVKLCGTHPNVPAEVNGFFLKNSESDAEYGHWYWENGY